MTAAVDRMTPLRAAPAWAGHAAGTPTYRRIVVALMAGGLANFSLMYFVQPLLPMMAAHYGVTAAESAHALSITTLTIILGLAATGPLADRVGRVAVMRWSLLASGVLGLLSAVAPTWPALLLLRGLLGLTLAGLPGAALAYLREEVDGPSHPRANAAYIAGTAVGGAAGRLLPGPLAAIGGWPLAAGVVSLVTLAAGILLLVLLPPSRGFRAHPVALRETLLGTLRAPADRVVALVCAVGFAAMGAFVGVYNAVAFRLQAAPFLLGAAASLVYLAYPVGIAAPAVARALAARIGRGRSVTAGVALLAVSVVLISFPALPAVVAGLGLITFAFLGTHSLLSGWVVDRAQRTGRGTAQASSAYLGTYYLGSTLAGALATWLWQTGGWVGVAVLGLGLCAIAATAAVAATRSDPSPQQVGEDDAIALA
ncbi:MAG: MFS transporter [Propionicimonas sp.]|uniref:MFS transporter n=1 Tax=Propionicimonas sp. TaxID=1955623 RepID=UPI003D0A7252